MTLDDVVARSDLPCPVSHQHKGAVSPDGVPSVLSRYGDNLWSAFPIDVAKATLLEWERHVHVGRRVASGDGPAGTFPVLLAMSDPGAGGRAVFLGRAIGFREALMVWLPIDFLESQILSLRTAIDTAERLAYARRER